MKNLGLTIDRLIRIDPELKDKLTGIKNKWKKNPSKSMLYWKELLDFLNSPALLVHSKRDELKSVVTSQRRPQKKFYTFDHVVEGDKIVGLIPEHLADMIKKFDRRTVALSKRNVEAVMTKNPDLMAYILRQQALMRVRYERMWIALKDYFNVWNNWHGSSFHIKIKGTSVVLTEMAEAPSNKPVISKTDPSNIKKFLDLLGLNSSDEDQQ